MLMKMSLQSALRRYYICFFSTYFLCIFTHRYPCLYLLQAGLSLQNVGLVFAILSITIIFLEVPTGGLADAIGRKKVALAGYFFTTYCYCNSYSSLASISFCFTQSLWALGYLWAQAV